MIYLIRHGMDDERYVGGHSNASLTKDGIKQIEETSSFIKKYLRVDKIITSDIKRAVETAEIISRDLNLEIIQDKSLRELDKGLLTGKLKEELTEEESSNLSTKDVNEKIIGGESMMDLYNRVLKLIDSGYFDDKDNYLIVTHRGFLNMLYVILNDDELTMHKKKYNVTHGSVHSFDLNTKTINRVY